MRYAERSACAAPVVGASTLATETTSAPIASQRPTEPRELLDLVCWKAVCWRGLRTTSLIPQSVDSHASASVRASPARSAASWTGDGQVPSSRDRKYPR
jgi:hypothetical protein